MGHYLLQEARCLLIAGAEKWHPRLDDRREVGTRPYSFKGY